MTSACAQSILMELQTNKNSNTNIVTITYSKNLDTNTNIRSWWKGSGARRNCSFIEINFSHSLLFYLCQQHYLGGARKTRKLSSLKWKKFLPKKFQPPFLKIIPTLSFNKLFQLFLRKICDDVGLLIRRVGEVRWGRMELNKSQLKHES